ncbi:MAG: VCBS repeat-containing protein, partial [bacterium]
MIKQLLLCAFVPLSLYASEFKDYSFIEGSLERVTTSDIPGGKWVRNHKSLKLSPSSFNFKPREWEPIPKQVNLINPEPEFGDIDNDGNYDLAIGSWPGDYIALFENIGTPYKPIFSKKKILYVSSYLGNISLGDYNSDGKIDLACIYQKNNVHFYKNLGNWKFERDPLWDILNIPLPEEYYIELTLDLGDLDNDKDSDLVLLYQYGTQATACNLKFLAYENRDNSFKRRTDWDLPPQYDKSMSKFWGTKIDLVDLDKNQTLDLVYTYNEWGWTYWYRNIGSVTFPIWNIYLGKYPYFLFYDKYGIIKVGIPGLDLLIGDIIAGTAGFIDLDKDGDPDMLMGNDDGYCLAFECIGYGTQTWGTESFPTPIYTFPERKYLLNGFHATGGIAFADIDNNGNYDEILGEGQSCADSSLQISLNKGIKEEPYFYKPADVYLNLEELDEYENYPDSRPTCADLDNDEKIDVLEGGWRDKGREAVGAFRNISSKTVSFEYYPQWNMTGDFLEQQGIDDFDLQDLWPFLVDLNNDKKYDMILSTRRYLVFLENIETKENPSFRRNTEWETDTDWGVYKGDFNDLVRPVVVDLDGDNQEDLIVCNWGQNVLHIFAFKRIGTPTQVLFERRLDWEDKLNSLFTAGNPFGFVDYDNDGDYELVVAYTGSGPALYLNQSPHHPLGTYTSPLFDAGSSVIFESIFYKERKPFETDIAMFVRY